MSGSRRRADGRPAPTTRADILKLAARLFAREGYKATTLEAVAGELHVTRQALYYHFGSKGEILAALFDDVMARLEQSADAASDVSLEERFLPLLRAHLWVIVTYTDLVTVLLHERPEIAKLEGSDAQHRRQAYSERFIDAYAAGSRTGLLRDLDPWVATNLTLASANSTSVWYRGRVRRGTKPEVMVQQVFEVLVSGILAPDAPREAAARLRATQEP